jgi:hypothetical protein
LNIGRTIAWDCSLLLTEQLLSSFLKQIGKIIEKAKTQ